MRYHYSTPIILLLILQFTLFTSAQVIRAFDSKSTLIREIPVNNTDQRASYYTVGDGRLNMEIWSPFGENNGGDSIAAVLLEAMQQHVAQTRRGGSDTIKWTLRIVGFKNSVDSPLCAQNNNTAGACPDIVIMGTSQVASRALKGDLQDLQFYFQRYFNEFGQQLNDDFTKFTYYDYFLDNKWMAIPFVSDLRLIYYNTTTFSTLNLTPPPPVGTWSNPYWNGWNWRTFADYAGQISRRFNQPGFSFVGAHDEETKLMTTIMRSYGSQMIKINQTSSSSSSSIRYSCGIKDDPNMKTALDEVVRKIFVTDKSVTSFIENDDNDFRVYMRTNTSSYSNISLNGIPAIPQPMLGMTFAFSGFMESGDIGVGYVPGQSTFLGGSGIGLTKNGKNKDMAWDLIKLIVRPESRFLTKAGLAVKSPPPYDSILQFQQPWTEASWSVHRSMMSRAMTVMYPLTSSPKTADIEKVHPFRTMLADLVYKNANNDVAINNFCSSIQEIVAPTCTLDDMVIVAGDCHANQTSTLIYQWKPNKVCSGGLSLPPPVIDVSCSYVHPRSAYSISVIVLICIGVLVAIMFIIFTLVHKDKPILKKSSPRFNATILFGAILIYSSVLFWVGKPTDFLCVGRVWALSLGFGLFLGGLLLKLWRVYKIFNRKKLTAVNLRDGQLFKILSIVMALEIIVLLAYTFIDPAMASRESRPVPLSSLSYQEDICRQPNLITTSVLFSFNLTLLLFTIYISWAIRSIPKQYNEDKVVTITVYAATLTIFIAGPTLFVVKNNVRPEISFLIYALSILFSTLFATTILCLPKFLKIMNGEIDVINSYPSSGTNDRSCSLCSRCQQPLLNNEGGSGSGGNSPVGPKIPPRQQLNTMTETRNLFQFQTSGVYPTKLQYY